MYRIICIGLICLLLAGCVPLAAAVDAGSDACLEFLEHIRTGNYASAYALIDEDVKNLSGQKTPPGEPYVTLTEFTDRYKNIFEEMGLFGTQYQVINTADGRVLSSMDYQMTYRTEKAGDLEFTFTITAEKKKEGWRILWTPALLFPDMDWGDTILYGINNPKRGEIFAADGDLLARNIPGVTVLCVPSKIDLGDHKPQFAVKELFAKEDEALSREEAYEKAQYEPFWNQIAGIPELATTPEKIRSALARTYNDTTKLAVLYPDQLTPDLEARLLAIPSIGIDKSGAFATLREYPYGEMFGHLLGYAGVIQYEYLHGKDIYGHPSDKKIDNEDEFYDGDSWLGYEGLEKEYEKTLRGEKGSFAYIQKKNGPNHVLFNNPAVNGVDLHLTVRPKLQRRLEDVYNTIVYDETILGTVIVLNPKTGAVEAMYSKPGYDPNKFTRGDFTEEEWNYLVNADGNGDKTAPLVNRCIQGLYPPGSTFKTLTAAATLESGAMGFQSLFPSSERLRWDVWTPTARGGEFAYTGIAPVRRTANTNRHEPMNMESSIIDSDNVFFSYCALKMGWDTFVWYLEKMGFYGTPTGRMLPGDRPETLGIPFDLPVAGPQIANHNHADFKENYDLLAMTGYGQGELLVTPLQMACYQSAFANGGDVMVPYLVGSAWRNADDANGRGRGYEQVSAHQPTLWRSITSRQNADNIAKAMWGVCKSRYNRGYERGGTGKDLGVFSFQIAGKTGTAEIGTKPEGSRLAPKELAWFIGFRYQDKEGGPVADGDQRLVLVMLELENDRLPTEASMMKFLIARALLMDSELTSEDADDEYLAMIS